MLRPSFCNWTTKRYWLKSTTSGFLVGQCFKHFDEILTIFLWYHHCHHVHVEVKDDLLLQLATDACAGLAALHRCFRQFNEHYANLDNFLFTKFHYANLDQYLLIKLPMKICWSIIETWLKIKIGDNSSIIFKNRFFSKFFPRKQIIGGPRPGCQELSFDTTMSP